MGSFFEKNLKRTKDANEKKTNDNEIFWAQVAKWPVKLPSLRVKNKVGRVHCGTTAAHLEEEPVQGQKHVEDRLMASATRLGPILSSPGENALTAGTEKKLQKCAEKLEKCFEKLNKCVEKSEKRCGKSEKFCDKSD